jgi:hypothetical protein
MKIFEEFEEYLRIYEEYGDFRKKKSFYAYLNFTSAFNLISW